MITYSRMMVQHLFSPDGVTLTIKPNKYRDRFPDYYDVKLNEETKSWEIVPYGIGLERIKIGTIPQGYRIVSKDKYEIKLRTEQPQGIKQTYRRRYKRA